MHPAKSVIAFTTLSGAGYGLMACLGLGWLLALPGDRLFALVACGLGLVLICAGLLASTVHLGRPERAWRALSQWRSSWLSREGVAAIVTFGPMVLFALLWVLLARHDGVVAMVGGLMALMAAVVVTCTAMIYASLRPVHAWHTGWTVAGYLVLAAMTGALLSYFLAALWQAEARPAAGVTLLLLAGGAAVKWAYWRRLDRSASASTRETATGLGDLGQVTPLEPPHTEPNYLLKEMGFRIARKHGGVLRRAVYGLAFAAPAGLAVLGLAVGGPGQSICAGLAVAICAVGVAVERWLFFAQAEHTVTLYYY